MTSKTQNGTSSQGGRETLLRKLDAWHHFMRAGTTCQQELEPPWQLCGHGEERLVTQCPGCGNPVHLLARISVRAVDGACPQLVPEGYPIGASFPSPRCRLPWESTTQEGTPPARAAAGGPAPGGAPSALRLGMMCVRIGQYFGLLRP